MWKNQHYEECFKNVPVVPILNFSVQSYSLNLLNYKQIKQKNPTKR